MTRLEELPARMDDLGAQVAQLRMEMRDEFSAVRVELRDVRAQMATEAFVRSEIAAVRADLAEQGAQMRVLHEDVIGRLALLQEGMTGAPRRRSRKK